MSQAVDLRPWAAGHRIEYVLGEGENYPGGVAMDDGTRITVCPFRDCVPIQAVRFAASGLHMARREVEHVASTGLQYLHDRPREPVAT